MCPVSQSSGVSGKTHCHRQGKAEPIGTGAVWSPVPVAPSAVASRAISNHVDFLFWPKRNAGAPCKVRWATLAPAETAPPDHLLASWGTETWVQPQLRARVCGLSRKAYSDGLGHCGHPASISRRPACCRVPCTGEGFLCPLLQLGRQVILGPKGSLL